MWAMLLLVILLGMWVFIGLYYLTLYISLNRVPKLNHHGMPFITPWQRRREEKFIERLTTRRKGEKWSDYRKRRKYGSEIEEYWKKFTDENEVMDAIVVEGD